MPRQTYKVRPTAVEPILQALKMAGYKPSRTSRLAMLAVAVDVDDDAQRMEVERIVRGLDATAQQL